jgi:hypothetical protein
MYLKSHWNAGGKERSSKIFQAPEKLAGISAERIGVTVKAILF